MAQENKTRLPFVLKGIRTRLCALFLQKLVLYDNQILEAKHLRHYDHQCEGLFGLINFIQRKLHKNQVFAFQTLKNYQADLSEEGQFIREDQLKQQPKKPYLKNLEGNATPRTRFFTRANTSIEESDNSFIFSPNLKKNVKTTCKTEYFGSSLNVGDQRSDILQKLLTTVKKVNNQTYQDSLQAAKSSYFNLTLGKQSLQTFQNQSQEDHQPPNFKKQSKQMKRRKILQKFENIQRKIYQEPPVYLASYGTSRVKNHVRKVKTPKIAYSVYEPYQQYEPYEQYEPIPIYENPGEVVYMTQNSKKRQPVQYVGSGLSSSRSVTHINYARQVYF